MQTKSDDSDLTPVAFIRDTEVAATLLKPPRLPLLAALREPDSATSLARRLGSSWSRSVAGAISPNASCGPPPAAT